MADCTDKAQKKRFTGGVTIKRTDESRTGENYTGTQAAGRQIGEQSMEIAGLGGRKQQQGRYGNRVGRGNGDPVGGDTSHCGRTDMKNGAWAMLGEIGMYSRRGRRERRNTRHWVCRDTTSVPLKAECTIETLSTGSRIREWKVAKDLGRTTLPQY